MFFSYKQKYFFKQKSIDIFVQMCFNVVNIFNDFEGKPVLFIMLQRVGGWCEPKRLSRMVWFLS